MRSPAETIIFGLKTIFSEKLSARLFEPQITQLLVYCMAHYKMTQLCMPESYPVA